MIDCIYHHYDRRIEIKGHANYCTPGYDIVCAGVSALEFALHSYLANKELIGESITNRLEPSSAVFVGTEKTDEAFECIWQGLVAIADNYPDYCRCWRG